VAWAVVSNVAPPWGVNPPTSRPGIRWAFFYFRAGGARFLGGVTLEMYNEFHHQAPVTERPVAL